jgi:ABC-type polysaccharide/polyol phosphate transport system ATPase subunit
MKAEINIEEVSLTFRIYRNPSPALKEIIVDRLLSRKPANQAVMEFEVLKNISLKVRAGDRLGIIGLNGAGKSTLLRMMVGIYPPSKGRIHTVGRITPLIEVGTGFDLEMSGRQNIYLNGALLAHSREEMREREQGIIEFSGLSEFIDAPIKYYSSGMLGRLAFSIATMVEPEILLVDEVFAMGDADFVDRATKRMLSLFDNSQIVIMVSHNDPQIKQLCNRCIVLHKGTIVGDGDPEEMIDLYYREIVPRQTQDATT